MKTISVLIDFRPTSEMATQYACWLSHETGAAVNLLHITNEQNPDTEDIKKKLIQFTKIDSHNVTYTVTVAKGEYLHEIPKQLQITDADFVVIGTHGVEGIYQALFGANVIKLIQSISISALVVQENTLSPSDQVSQILFPVGIHDKFDAMIKKAAVWALDLDANVDIFAVLKNDGTDRETLKNLDRTKDYFDKHKVRYKTVIKDTTIYSVGYAREILAHAKEGKAGLITMLSQVSEENRYFGNMDKTNLVLNPQGIPVLCVAD